MKKISILVKQVLMSTLTAATMSFATAFTACSDDLDLQNAPETPESTMTRSIEEVSEGYNINEDKLMDKQGIIFDASNWNKHTHIYVFVDGSNYDQNITDINGNKKMGYRRVALPWNNKESNSHLPMNFLSNFTPESGWQLVLNRCGSNNIANNNFMVFYNKYSGMARFFYYVPDNAGVNASDHAWEVMLSDNLAKHSTLRYGVPSDVQINKAAIGQNNAGYYTHVVTPWVNSLSELGGAVVSNGWYAFDVDMSQYRSNPADNFNTANDKVQLQMKAWQTSRVNLYGTMTADIKGEFKMPVSASNNSIYGAFGDYIETGEGIHGKVMDVADALTKQDYWGAFRKGMDFVQEGANLMGFTDETGKKNGQINMQMNGTIDMSGTMTTPVSAQGLCNPQMSISLFDTKNTTFGQGIWNIKKSPVVYRLSTHVEKFNFTCSDEEEFREHITFMDPSSVEIELNPKAFDGQEIEWMKSQAVYVARAAHGLNGTTDYLNAMNLTNGYNEWGVQDDKDHTTLIDPKNGCYYYDAFDSKEDIKNGMEITALKGILQVNNVTTNFMGRGNDKMIIEPSLMAHWKCTKEGIDILPHALEVNVTLTVKLKGMKQPIVMSRVYLPEVKMLHCRDLNEVKALYKKIKNGKKSHNTDLYDQQLKHISRLMYWGNTAFNAENINSQEKLERTYNNWKKFVSQMENDEEVQNLAKQLKPAKSIIPGIKKSPKAVYESILQSTFKEFKKSHDDTITPENFSELRTLLIRNLKAKI